MPNATPVAETSQRTPWRRIVAPIAVTILLVLWTLAVSPTSSYGDNWAIWPALLALPAVLLWHVALVMLLREHRRSAALVAAGHLALLVPLWFGCLMLISKDSL
jgi:hypothetical protein